MSKTTWRTLSRADSRRIRCQGHYRAYPACCDAQATHCMTTEGGMSSVSFHYVCSPGKASFAREDAA